MNIIDDLKVQFNIGGVVTKLIFWNIALFAIPSVVFGVLALLQLPIDYLPYISLSSSPLDLLWKPWSVLSFAFFHAGIFHILFNLLMLNFVGRLFLTFFTQKQLLSLYFVSSLFAGFVYILGYQFIPLLANNNAELIGASASVMAILFATVAYAPMMELRLMFFGSVKLWQMAMVFVVIDFIQLPLNNSGGHLAHLGGALFGYLYIKQLQKGFDLCKWFTIITDALVNLFSGRNATPFKKVHRNYNPPVVKTVSKVVTKDRTQQQIDDILDKISQSGYDSLSAAEKEFLFKAGK
jgi:membrane associated rhomboid family serine protease